MNSIGWNCCSSRSRRWRLSGMCRLPRNKSQRQRQRRCCSISTASGRSSPPSSGRKGCSGTSTIDAKSLLMRAWRQHPGKADRLIANKACRKQAIRDCEQRLSSSRGYGCAISRTRRWPCGLKNGSGAMAAAQEDDNRGAGAQVADSALEICDRRRCHRGSRDETYLTINADRILKSSRT